MHRHPSNIRARLGSLTLVVSLLALTGGATGSAHGAIDASAWPRGVAVVGYSSKRALHRALARYPGRIVQRSARLQAVEIRPSGDISRFVNGVGRMRGIAYVERVVSRRSATEPALVPALVPGGAYEWQFAAAHEDTVPDAVVQAASRVTIAVLDTGGDVAAPDLAAKSPTTWSVLTGTTDVTDTNGHGTFVSSLAAGAPANGEGIAGFGGDAKLMIVQTGAPDGSVSDVDEANGIVYAVDHGANVINMSFGGAGTSSTEQNAVAYAASHGVLLVASAGNSALSGNPTEYPAALLQPLGSNGLGGIGLAVGATDVTGARAAFSNTGSYLSLAAPGENVFGAISASSDPTHWIRSSLPGSAAGLYGFASGTSFSSPETAGAAALVWGANPNLNASGVAQILKDTATTHGVWSPELGYGVIDVGAAVDRALAIGASAAPVTLTGTASGTHVHLNWASTSARSYSLSVAQDGAAAKLLLGSTTSTSADFDLTLGHSYTFTITALNAFGLTTVSTPYTLSLAQAGSTLRLRASRLTGRGRLRIRFGATLASTVPAVSAARRPVVLESFDGRFWRRFATGTTDSNGGVAVSAVFRRGRYRVRARFAGTVELAAAVSPTLSLRVR